MTQFIIREYREEDLPALATHWRESVKGWPPGEFTGMDFTPEGIRNALFKVKYEAVWVAAGGEKIIGYMNYNSHYNERDARYIELLNVQPDFQSIGAGRDLLRAGVERAVEDGAKRLDLHTWAANTKAVPLYKKTGFFWRPNTEVHMYNFLPTVLRNPYVKRFLGDADWYPHLRQDLSVEESLDVVDGCHIQRYKFEKDGRQLEVWVDPSTSGITAIIGDEIDIRCLIAGEKHIAGMTYPVKWQFVNKKDDPANISVSCKGTRGVKYEFNEQFSLTGEKTFDTSATLATDIQPEIEDWWGHPIECTITVDDMELGFRPGLKAMPPFKLEIKPGPVVLSPGEEKHFSLNLTSRFPSDAEFIPKLEATGNISLAGEIPSYPINIPPEARIGVNVSIAASENAGDGAVEISGIVKSKNQEIEIEPLVAYARVADKGQPVAVKDHNPKVTHLSNGIIDLTLQYEGGKIGFKHCENGDVFLSITHHSIGEPFSVEMDSTEHEVATLEGSGDVYAIMRGSSRDFPGLTLEVHIRLDANNRINIWEELVNNGSKSFTGRTKLSLGTSNIESLTVPLLSGLVEGNPNIWLSGNDPLPTERLYYAETWSAYRRHGGIFGIIAEDFDKMGLSQWRPGPKYEWKVRDLQPSGRISLPKVTIIPNAPSVESVRHFALQDNQRAIEAVPRPPMHVRGPLFAANDRKYPMAFHYARGVAVKASAEVVLPDNSTYSTESEEWEVENPMHIDIPIEGKKPGIIPVDYRIRMNSRRVENVTPVSIVPTGMGIKVTETEDEGFYTFIVDNGAFKFKISPEFCGVMRWLSESGANAENLLNTPFPETGEFSWLKPWFGGMELLCWQLSYRFYKSRFSVVPYEAILFGHKWEGVRVDVSLLRDYSSLKMEIFYLTLPGAPVVMLLQRFTEPLGCMREIEFDCLLYPRPGGPSQEEVYSRYGIDDGKATVSYGEDGGDFMGRLWATTTDCASGRTLGLINPQGKAGIWDNGKLGHAPWLIYKIRTHPKRPVNFNSFITITESPEEVELLAKELQFWVV